MHRFSLAVLMAFAVAASPTLGSANECPAASGSVRVMVHATNLITGRLKLAVKAGRSPDRQARALRELFEAAGCPQIREFGTRRKRDVTCTVPGTSDRIIVVGVNHRYDSVASAALLPSLAEALAAAPRRHTYRWVGFSPHEVRGDRTKVTPKPKGAMRLLDGMSDEERARVDVMVHIGPMGYGPFTVHPPQADQRLECALESAVQAAGMELVAEQIVVGGCPETDPVLRAKLSEGSCRGPDWSGGNDWLPFRRAGIPVFGVHSGSETKAGGKLDGRLYVRSYRALAVFLALADEVLAGAPPAANGAAASESSGVAATSPR